MGNIKQVTLHMKEIRKRCLNWNFIFIDVSDYMPGPSMMYKILWSFNGTRENL